MVEQRPGRVRGGVRRRGRRVHHHRHRRHAVHPRNSHHRVGAVDAAKALTPFAGHYAEALFGIGLFGATLLAARSSPSPTSYVVSESLGYEKGIGRGANEAPVFVTVITAMIVVAAMVAMVPGNPGDLPAGRRAGGQRRAPPHQPVLHLEAVAQPRSWAASQPDARRLDRVTVLITSTLSLTLVAVTVVGL